MDDNKIEFTSRGKRQIRSILHTEIKEQIDKLIEPMIKKIINNRIETKLNVYLSTYKLEELVKGQIRNIWWSIVEEMLRKANFQDRLQDEIIEYLHKKWACGTTPFEEQFDKALMKAIKKLIGG